ncbi:MAG: hypothetical protein Q9165_005707 [Trypethelium subeluteriae]
MSNLKLLQLLLLHLLYVQATPINSTKCSANSITSPQVYGVEIISLTTTVITNYALEIPTFTNNWPAQNISGLSFCQINVTLTHPSANDTVLNQVWLPLDAWNGRFIGIGGGGYEAISNWNTLAPAVQRGYAAVGTDAGVGMNPNSPDAWALASPGNVNQYLLLDFASRSVHEMTVIGKQVVESFYGIPPKYSYWQGCSTGGRQGLGEAQNYPDDYDGIVAAAPAVNWNDFTPAQQWPYTVMNNERHFPRQCEFDYATAAAVSACDAIDGLVDGIIGAPGHCFFSPSTIVGETFDCDDNSTVLFSNATAKVIQMIWDGPKTVDGTPAAQVWKGPTTLEGDSLWYGILRGANFSTLAPTVTLPNGSTLAQPFAISDGWFRDFLYKNVSADTARIDYSDFQSLFQKSHQQYDSVIGTSDANLGPFRKRGAKMITWQGLADGTIMPNGTTKFYDRVNGIYPDTQDFYRVFFAPGVGHCGNGYGPLPVDVLGALRDWVENGTVPETLAASSASAINGTPRHQALCPYPAVSRYTNGDPILSASYECANGS